MGWLKKVIVTLAVATAVLILGTIGAYWWANSTPGRPRGVSAKAVYLQAPGLALPTAPHGTWLECWQRSERYSCKSTMADGTLLLEDEYLPYGSKHQISAGELTIDLTKTGHEYVHAPNGYPTPLIHLQSGEILIPATRYQEGMRYLERFPP